MQGFGGVDDAEEVSGALCFCGVEAGAGRHDGAEQIAHVNNLVWPVALSIAVWIPPRAVAWKLALRESWPVADRLAERRT